jgi:hypothetical protein
MPISNLAVGVLFAGLLVGLVLAPRKLIDAPSFTLFRCFFPAWRFFEAIGPSPKLSYRLIVAEQPGPWTDVLVSEPRALSALILNARGNLQLACQSLVEQLHGDLQIIPSADVTQLVSYQLVNNLVASCITADLELGAGHRYEFRIVAPRDDQHDQHEQDDSFSSGTLTL